MSYLPDSYKFRSEPGVSVFRFQDFATRFPYLKLHYAAGAASAAKIICQGTRFARTLTYTMMRISETIGDLHSAL